METIMPRWEHREQHARWYDHPAEEVWDALHALHVDDLRLTDVLVRLRSGPPSWFASSSPNAGLSVLDAVAPRPVLSRPPHELVLGDVANYMKARPERPPGLVRGDLGQFMDFADPGYSKVIMNFRLEPRRGGTRLTTETRVRSTDAFTRRAFRAYWVVVRAGSGLVRHDILRAIGKNLDEKTP